MKSPWEVLQQLFASFPGSIDLILAIFSVMVAWVFTNWLRMVLS